MGRPMINTKLYFHRSKESNNELAQEAKELGFSENNYRDLYYLGYEIEFDVNITEGEDGDLVVTVLKSPDKLL